MWVILCPRRNQLVVERLVPPARARKRSDVTRGHGGQIYSKTTSKTISKTI